MNIKIFVISFNRLSALQESISSFQKFFENHNIFIIDKASTYEPLLPYYDGLIKSGINIIYSDAMTDGAAGPGGLNDLYKVIDPLITDCDFYVVTDPDISIHNCSGDILQVYATLLNEMPDINIVGPMLRIDDIPENYPAREVCYWKHCEQFWHKKPKSTWVNDKEVYYQSAPIDSTFGMLRGNTSFKRLYQGIRTYYPYDAKHLDWYITPENITKDQLNYSQSTNTVSHWGTRLYKNQPNFSKLSGEQRNIYTTVEKNGKIELIKKRLPGEDPVIDGNTILIPKFSGVKNLGDQLNKYIVGKLSNQKVKVTEKAPSEQEHFFITGSTLAFANPQSIVWGSGFMFKESKLATAPKRICAVRGPKSRELLLKNKVDCPEIYGDPALLLPRFYQPTTKKKYKLGVIPHYIDKDSSWVKALLKNEDVLFIDIQTDSVEEFVDALTSCEKIISSSLNGVMIADAYGVPSMWVELSDKVAGNGFKFEDYFLSVNRKLLESKLNMKSTKLEYIITQFTEYKISIDLDALLKICPLTQD